MQFKLNKILRDGRYYITVGIVQPAPDDEKKAAKFGYPVINIKLENGVKAGVPINTANRYPPFGFYNQKEADEYVLELKQQLVLIKTRWDTLNDTWSNEEII